MTPASSRVSAGEDYVCALRHERKVIFHQHFDIAKTGIGKVRGQDWEAALQEDCSAGAARRPVRYSICSSICSTNDWAS